jgi:hypothetical protein
MPTIRTVAYPQDAKRIVFDARCHRPVNVGTRRNDRPLGFSSGVLVLVTLGNCALSKFEKSAELENGEISRRQGSLNLRQKGKHSTLRSDAEEKIAIREAMAGKRTTTEFHYLPWKLLNLAEPIPA